MELNIILAFTAGLASFLAPCVVPLVPAYISFITGVSFAELSRGNKKYTNKILINSLLYILGFSLIFVLLGLTATTIGRFFLINRVDLMRVGGIFIILFGFYNLKLFNFLGLGRREFKIRPPMKFERVRYLGPFILGITFALAWTPCVGAILGGILTLAATSKNASDGAILLLFYSLGISLPFLIIGLSLSKTYKYFVSFTSKLKYIGTVGGVILIILGLALFFQKYDLVTSFVSSIFSFAKF